MRKYKATFLLIFVIIVVFALASCDGYSEMAQSEANPNHSGLQVVQISSNGFGVVFLFRNESGNRLYFDDRFRLDGVSMMEQNNRVGVLYINHGDVKQSHVSWRSLRATGIYTFERDFFIDPEALLIHDTPQPTATISFDFAVVSWDERDDDIPDDVRTMRDQRDDRYIAFWLDAGTSDVITASEVEVSRTAVAFRTFNSSQYSFIHGLGFRLLVYEDGWRFFSDAQITILLGVEMRGGGTTNDHLDFPQSFGILPNGRYMIMRVHNRDSVRPGAARVQEMLMIEFVIDDDTPETL